MANEKEVKAQVRLRFWNVNRQRMTATRNLQVTVKKGGGLTMKTLEGILAKTDVDGGEGKVGPLPLWALTNSADICISAIRSPRNAQRWTRRCPCYWASLEVSWRTSSSAIRKSQTGHCLSLPLLKRSLTISSRRPSESGVNQLIRAGADIQVYKSARQHPRSAQGAHSRVEGG